MSNPYKEGRQKSFMEDPRLTPTVNEETPTPVETSVETAPTVETPEPPKEPEVDYKKKFSESAKEAQRLAKEAKELREKVSPWEDLEKQGYKPEDIEAVIKGDGANLDLIKMRRETESVKREQVKFRNEFELNQFITKNPEIEPLKETLRALHQAFPEKGYKDLYEEHLDTVINFGQQRVYSKLEQKKSSQVESGKGSGEKKVSLSPDDFKKLSVDKQQDYLKEQGL